jgi:hypothetical protein
MKKIWRTESDSRESLPARIASAPGFPAPLSWGEPLVNLSLRERRVVFANATYFYRKCGGTRRARVPDRGHSYLRVLIEALTFWATDAGNGE